VVWGSQGALKVIGNVTLLHTDNHASTLPLSFLQARCPSCRQTNSVKALKETLYKLKLKRFKIL